MPLVCCSMVFWLAEDWQSQMPNTCIWKHMPGTCMPSYQPGNDALTSRVMNHDNCAEDALAHKCHRLMHPSRVKSKQLEWLLCCRLSCLQMESTMAMQAVAPRVKELQAKYANDPENLQLETARLYKSAGINPLAGCLPTLATIPVFIGLYRALTKAADEGLLTSGFFWIPSLGGPTSMAMRQAGSGLSWLFPFKDGQPPIGWHDAIAYLILPALLVVSQFASQKIVSPKTDDPQQKQTQAILGFIPFMIGWFSLNVPSGLTLYWFVNNIISTALQLYMKQTIKMDLSPAAAAGDASGIIDVTGTVIKPKEDRVKQVSGKELGARKKRREDEEVSPSSTAADSSSSSAAPRSNRGQKFRARKSREAAAKAASVAQANGSAEQGAKATATSELDLVKVPDAAPSKE
eukprot:GHRR01021804.1.p1 GENE.GHRR01021804.1~~GHRR01021804.1.p1  ORF type:complete len:405 (+),score=126.33 GHRR01021804.1:88-1302(+)